MCKRDLCGVKFGVCVRVGGGGGRKGANSLAKCTLSYMTFNYLSTLFHANSLAKYKLKLSSMISTAHLLFSMHFTVHRPFAKLLEHNYVECIV